MKIGFLSIATRLLIFAGTIIIVCVFCVLIFKTTNEGKSITSAGTYQLNSMYAEYGNLEKAIYDDTTILGTELVSLIKEVIERDETISIVVRTLESSRTDYNYVYDNVSDSLLGAGTKVIEKSKAQGAYINRSAQFKGTVKKDTNNNIICLWFEQMK